ncbi:F-box/WD repeat-containing protein 10 [Polyrhizophydium stewartii]|uniref:F-box/WD repeat-containing protein 10 n=1 Tax=Polyrhizophydium stewartii TaxID=2732419 RepID=A0ABR4N857_9FUNG
MPSGPDDEAWSLACGFKDGVIRRWHLKRHAANTEAEPLAQFDSVSDWATSVDGCDFAGVFVSGSWDCQVRIWDSTTGQLRRVLQRADSSSAIMSLVKAGRTVVAGCYNGSLAVWSL